MILHENSNINDNGFLCSLDMMHATKKDTLEWLAKIIDNETRKPEEEQDQNLIVECLAGIDDLLADEVTVSDEDLKKGLEKINQEIDDEDKQKTATKITGKKRMLKALLAVAASFTVLFSGVAIAAATQGYDSAWAFLKDNLKKIVQLEPGDSISEGNITFSKNGETVSYKTLEELLQAEKYNCMRFNYLPNNVKIKRVIEEKSENNQIKLFFLFDTSNIHIAIYNYQNTTEEKLNNYPIHQTASIKFYIQRKESDQYLAIGYLNGYEYQIMYNNYEELVKILDNMKGNVS